MIVSTVLLACFAKAQQWPGYTLFAPMNGTSAYLLDTNGNVFHSWSFPASAKTSYSTYLLSGGVLLRTVVKSVGNQFSGTGPISGQVQKVDWEGNILWDYTYSTNDYCSHHDICPMPNGNVLLIAYERRSAAEAGAAGATTAMEMWPDKIVEVQPTGPNTGIVAWEWKAWDHLVQNVDPTRANYQSSVAAHPELLHINYKTAKDWLHLNGVAYNADLDQVVFSSRNFNELYVIDHSTTTAEAAGHSGGNSGRGGDILYRWGNPAAYGVSAPAVFNVVHDAHWIPNGCPRAGWLSAFNNKGIMSPGTKTTIDLINPPLTGYSYTLAGSTYAPATYSWRHNTNAYSSNMGSAQQLPNGNMLITISTSGRIYEIDANETIIWDVTYPVYIAKAFRYPACDVRGSRPDRPTISQAANTIYSSVATPNSTYHWYLNGNALAGATAQSYVPTQGGIYTVIVMDSIGCTSEASLPFFATAVNEISSVSGVTVYPNPATDLVNIGVGGGVLNYSVSVFDRYGKLLQNIPNAPSVDLLAYQPGVYFFSIRTEGGVFNSRVLVIR